MSYFKTQNKKDCCACSACIQGCPVQAISFVNDVEGFAYPAIDKDTCINCGLCERICPVSNSKYDNSEAPEVYASLLKDVEERKKSTSGGLFYAIAEWVLEKGGVVFGAAMNEHHQVRHITVENNLDLQLLRGSKYVQSAMGDTFLQVKKKLEEGRWCYFTGTGCQVAGLKAFLRKDYSTLITSDIVCHGVPSQWLYDQHISYIEKKYKGTVIEYQFRNNEKGTGGEIFLVDTPKGKIKKVINPTYNLSPYLYSFMYGMTSRWSCYDCKFARIPRQGDITLADYWGVKEFFPDLDNSKGVSLCLTNTEQGKKVWEAVKEKCEFRESNIINAAKYNGNLIGTSQPHKIRPSIYDKIKKDGYGKVVVEEFRHPRHNSIRMNVWINQSGFLKACVKGLAWLKHKFV